MNDGPAEERIDELEARVRRLELELEQLRAVAGATPPAGAVTPTAPPVVPAPGPAPPWARSPSRLPPPPIERPGAAPVEVAADRQQLVVESETVLKWGGVVLVVLAVGFAVSTAIRRGWIGPGLQLVGALLVSIVLIAVGLRLRPTRPGWTHALCSGGVAALFTTVASDLFLDQTSDDTAFVCTFVIGLGGYGLARLVPSEWVGAVGLVGGIAAWLVIADGEPPFVATWIWMVVLVAGALTLALDQRWFGLRLLGHVMGMWVAVGLAVDADGDVEQFLVLVAGALVFASLARLPSIGELDTPWEQLEVQLVMAAAPWAIAVIGITFELESDTAVGSTGLAVAAASASIAVGVRVWVKHAHFVSLLVGASVAMSIGFVALLSSDFMAVALAVQAVGLVILSRALGSNTRLLVNAGIVAAIAALVVTVDMLEAWTTDAPVGDDIAHLATIAALAVAGWQARDEQLRRLTAMVVLVGVLVWLGSVLVHLPQGQAAVSVSWAVVGIAVLVTGAVRKIPEAGGAGLAVLAATVAKLLTVDLREVDTLWRAGLFFLIGTGIMRLGFLLPRLTGATEGADGGGAQDSGGSTHPSKPPPPESKVSTKGRR